MSKIRIEKDSLGEVEVPNEALHGAQTQRSLNNFKIGTQKIPFEIIRALAQIKKAVSQTNAEIGVLDNNKAKIIGEVCDEIIQEKLDTYFNLSVWQTGSGTQTNMNLNEVISTRSNQILSGKINSKFPIHPNDDVNKSQSSNDVFPSGIHLASLKLMDKKLFSVLQDFISVLKQKSKEFEDIQKVGRTHLMDATNISLGFEFEAFADQLESIQKSLKIKFEDIQKIPLGGTATGDGLNTPENFATKICQKLSLNTGYKIQTVKNLSALTASHNSLTSLHGELKVLATSLFKIVNDLRWMSSGPRTGLSEIKIPENEPGSSIMPGKVNPTQAEAVLMICAQVLGNDFAVSFANSQGNFQLNVFKPLIGYNLIESLNLLSDGMDSFRKNCLSGITPNLKNLNQNIQKNIMDITRLTPKIGYEDAAKIAILAYKNEIGIEEAASVLEIDIFS